MCIVWTVALFGVQIKYSLRFGIWCALDICESVGPRALSFDLSFEFWFVFCVLRFVFCFVFSYLSLVFENLGGPRALSFDLCLAIWVLICVCDLCLAIFQCSLRRLFQFRRRPSTFAAMIHFSLPMIATWQVANDCHLTYNVCLVQISTGLQMPMMTLVQISTTSPLTCRRCLRGTNSIQSSKIPALQHCRRVEDITSMPLRSEAHFFIVNDSRQLFQVWGNFFDSFIWPCKMFLAVSMLLITRTLV